MAETSAYLGAVLVLEGSEGHNFFSKRNQKKKHKNQKHQFIALNVRMVSRKRHHQLVDCETAYWLPQMVEFHFSLQRSSSREVYSWGGPSILLIKSGTTSSLPRKVSETSS